MKKEQEIINEIPLILEKIENISSKYNTTPVILLKELVRFFDLIYIEKIRLSPSYAVDLAWHELILFTRFYDTFCKKHYNRFIHHTPEKSNNPEAFKKTIKLYTKHYGLPTTNVWSNLTKEEWNSSNCGSCIN